ncbi:MAG TPA: glycosyltransferase [Candidatus Angelobacter sp.]|nr:glycosyltransferase [Candidatus Angelobacter sp.]
MKARICYLIGSLGSGGAEGQLLELIRGLNREMFDPSLILETAIGLTRVKDLEANVKTLEVVPLAGRKVAPRGYYASRALRRLCAHISELRPDILHAFLPACVIYASAARMLKRVPCTIASRRSLVDCYRPNSRLAAVADMFATRAADFVVGNSEAIIQEVVALDHVPHLRTRVIYNGVDTRRFSPLQKPGWRSALGWHHGHLVFGMVANFAPYKRHIDLVKAASLIRNEIPQARFLLVGEDRGEMIPVRQAIAEAGLTDYIQIVPGTNTPELAFSTMDVYVCTSESEGLSNVLLEAMATGLPVIATDVGGNREAIAEGLNGILTPAHSPESIARAAVEFAQDPGRIRRFADNSLRRARELFSLTQMVRQHEDLYTCLLSQKRTATWKRIAGIT